MAAVTTMPGFGAPAHPASRRLRARDATPRVSRVSPTTYRRRRVAALALALGVVVVAGEAGAALGGSPLAASERRPTTIDHTVVVRPGDTLWSIAERLSPDDDPRPVVDSLSDARRGAPLVPGERIRWPR